MLKRWKTFLTSRKTVLALIVALTAALGAGVAFRQGGDPGGAPSPALVRWLGLDHVFSTWWFVALALVFLLSLVASTFDQLQGARARTFRAPPAAGPAAVRSPLPPAEVSRRLAREGFRLLAEAPGRRRHVKHAVGHWGSFLLHVGMTVTVLFALVYVTTEHRLIVRVTSGEATPVRAGTGAHLERRGLLARELPLPAAVTLAQLEPTFWENDKLRDLASALVLAEGAGTWRDLRVGVNAHEDYRGLTVYQQLRFGTAFQLLLARGGEAPAPVVLELPFPAHRDAPAYGGVPLAAPGEELKAKYLARADRAGVVPPDPELVLRLYQAGQLSGEVTLREGGAARLGPYEVRLAAVRWWTDILFEGSRGTAGIFAGFALLLAGGVLAFFAVPREVVVQEVPGGSAVEWRAARFADFLREEKDRVMSTLVEEASR